MGAQRISRNTMRSSLQSPGRSVSAPISGMIEDGNAPLDLGPVHPISALNNPIVNEYQDVPAGVSRVSTPRPITTTQSSRVSQSPSPFLTTSDSSGSSNDDTTTTDNESGTDDIKVNTGQFTESDGDSTDSKVPARSIPTPVSTNSPGKVYFPRPTIAISHRRGYKRGQNTRKSNR